MSLSIAPAKEGATTSSMPVAREGAPAATGYRISILPAGLEISARLATVEELQMLVKILQANAVILANAKGDLHQVPVASEAKGSD